MALGLAGRRPELVLEIAPLRSGPPIRSGNPGGRARVDPVVQHLVAFPQLLPLEFLEAAARRHGHQLFGDQLLDPFGFRAMREMDEARRGSGARGDVIIRGSGKPEIAIGLGLEGRDGDRPKPRTTADLAAAFRRIDKARAGDRRGPVEPLDALDRCDLGKPGTAPPRRDGGSLIAGVDGELGDAKPCAMGMRPGPPEQARQLAPARLALRTASDHNMINAGTARST